MPSRFVSTSRQASVRWRASPSPTILKTRRTFGLRAPGPIVSATSTSALLRQSHIDRSSDGQCEGSLDPPGAVAVLSAPASPPQPGTSAIDPVAIESAAHQLKRLTKRRLKTSRVIALLLHHALLARPRRHLLRTVTILPSAAQEPRVPELPR